MQQCKEDGLNRDLADELCVCRPHISVDKAERDDRRVISQILQSMNPLVGGDGELVYNSIYKENRIGAEENIREKDKLGNSCRLGSHDVTGHTKACNSKAYNVKNAGYSTGKAIRLSKRRTHLFSDGVADQQRDFLFLCAGLTVQAVGFQLRSISEVFTIITSQFHRAYFFALYTVELLSRGKDRICETYFNLVSRFVPGGDRKSLALFKEEMETLKLLLILGFKRMLFGCFKVAILLLLAALVLFILIFGYFVVMRSTSEQKPHRIAKEIFFDYTKSHPVVMIDFIALLAHKNLNLSRIGKNMRLRLRSRIFLTVPDSDYNRNLGVFQITSELLSESGDILSKTSHPGLLNFNSNALRYMKATFSAFLLLTGAMSETQTLSVPSIAWQQGEVSIISASILKISLVPRAGRVSSNGIPELYKSEIEVAMDWMPLSPDYSWRITTFVICVGSVLLFLRSLSSLGIYNLRQHWKILEWAGRRE